MNVRIQIELILNNEPDSAKVLNTGESATRWADRKRPDFESNCGPLHLDERLFLQVGTSPGAWIYKFLKIIIKKTCFLELIIPAYSKNDPDHVAYL